MPSLMFSANHRVVFVLAPKPRQNIGREDGNTGTSGHSRQCSPGAGFSMGELISTDDDSNEAGDFSNRSGEEVLKSLEVLQDTPLNDAEAARKLRVHVQQVDNLSDREDQKLERTQVRFCRVREFLDYLQKEEQREEQEFELAKRGGIWAEPFVPAIREQVEAEISWIERRLKENRERFADDIRFGPDGDEGSDLDLLGSDTDEESDEESEEQAKPAAGSEG